MMFTGAGKVFYTVQQDFQEEAANITALVFPETQFQLLSQKIGSDNLSITFKNQRHFSENFRVRFFPKNKTLILSRYDKKGIVHLIYIPANNYNWLNSRGCKINYPDSIKEKFEFLAYKFYPFLEEFFLG